MLNFDDVADVAGKIYAMTYVSDVSKIKNFL